MPPNQVELSRHVFKHKKMLSFFLELPPNHYDHSTNELSPCSLIFAAFLNTLSQLISIHLTAQFC